MRLVALLALFVPALFSCEKDYGPEAESIFLSDETSNVVWYTTSIAWLNESEIAFAGFSKSDSRNDWTNNLYVLDVEDGERSVIVDDFLGERTCLSKDGLYVYRRGASREEATRFGRRLEDFSVEIDVPQRSFDACGRVPVSELIPGATRGSHHEIVAPLSGVYLFDELEERTPDNVNDLKFWVVKDGTVHEVQVDWPSLFGPGQSSAADRPVLAVTGHRDSIVSIFPLSLYTSELRQHPETDLPLLPVVDIRHDFTADIAFFQMPRDFGEYSSIKALPYRDGLVLSIQGRRGEGPREEGLWILRENGSARYVLRERVEGGGHVVDPTGCRVIAPLYAPTPRGQRRFSRVKLVEICDLE